MSEVLQRHQCGNPLSHVVKADHKLYYIDSCLTADAGYETMVFPMADTYLFDTKHTIPFDDYVDESLSHYILQLSAYQIPLEDLGLKILARRIIWLKPDGTYEQISVPNVTERIRKAFDL